MPKIAIAKTREAKRQRRHLRVRNTISGTAERPRLVVFRSLKHITAQLVDDTQGRTIFTVTSASIGEGKKTEKSLAVGKRVAERAKTQGIGSVVFDRAGNKYHGRVAALAEAAREGGLDF